VDLTAEDFFEALSQDMTERGTTSQELVALEFDPASGEISVLGSVAVHAAGYPALRTLLEKNRESLCGRWNRRAPASTDYLSGGADNPGVGFLRRKVGTP
jgi:hypothetical protein